MNGVELGVAARVGAGFEAVGVPWLIGGSMASSAFGVPRATNDVDLVAALSLAQVDGFARHLGLDFYADEDAIREAARRGSAFNLIDQESVTKVDVFVARPGSHAARELARRVWLDIGTGGSALRLPFASAADIVVEKLVWFDRGGRTSDRQWRDVIGVLQTQGVALDRGLLSDLAEERGVRTLLAAAFAAVDG